MANALYDFGKKSLLEGSINWLTDDIRAILVDISGGNYVVDLAADENIGNIVVGDRVSDAVALASKTTDSPTDGVADAADTTLTTVTTGITLSAVVVYKHDAVEANSILLAYIDTATGLSTTTDGTDVVVTWDSGANRIFAL